MDLVVAVGGDGTVRGCAEGLAGTDVPMGIVPLGTGNLLARTLGIPAHPKAALAVALSARHSAHSTHSTHKAHSTHNTHNSTDTRIDLATADGMPFTAMAGMGLDAAVVAATKLKHHFGWLAYAMSGAVHLAIPPVPFSIRIDDGPAITREARSVVVGNSGLLPGGFTLLPEARVDDGLLDVGVLAPHGPFGWVQVATRVLTHSRHQDRHLERLQARKVEITAGAALPREVDGEIIRPARTLTVLIRPAALIVRVPAIARGRR
jgi:undecaprenyl-diphosphatase